MMLITEANIKSHRMCDRFSVCLLLGSLLSVLFW